MKDLPFVVSKVLNSTTSQVNSDLFLKFAKLGLKGEKIGKYIRICMENAQKSSKRLIAILFLLQFTKRFTQNKFIGVLTTYVS